MNTTEYKTLTQLQEEVNRQVRHDMIECLKQTHCQAARRENASTQVLIGTWESNGKNLLKAITAAMQTFGGAHAPIKLAYHLIQQCTDHSQAAKWYDFYNDKGDKVPGFGSSFVKGGPDPLLSNLAGWITKEQKEIAEYFYYFFVSNKDKPRHLWPNLAFYTACAAINLGININFCEHLMIEARIEEWVRILKEREG